MYYYKRKKIKLIIINNLGLLITRNCKNKIYLEYNNYSNEYDL